MGIIYALYYLIAVSFLISYYRSYSLSAVSVFVAMQLFVFTGFIYLLPERPDYPAYDTAVVIYFVAMLFFISGVVFSNLRKRRKPVMMTNRSTEPLSGYQWGIIWTIIVVSIISNAIFFYKAGVNVFISSLLEIIAGKELSNYTLARKDFTDVFGVGIIYQFRVILQPVLNLFLLLQQQSKAQRRWGILILPLTMIFLVGTGQRYGLVFFFILSLVSLYMIRKEFHIKYNLKAISLFLFSGFLILALITMANGRVDNSNSASVTANIVNSILERAFEENAITVQEGFDYVNDHPTAWGKDWGIMLIEILPGKQTDYIPVDYQIFQRRFGSLNGTSPPCIWASAFYNWSWFGVTFFPFTLGFLFQKLHGRYLRGNHRNILNTILYTTLCCYLGMWYFGSPAVIFNGGTITVLILTFILFNLSFRERRLYLKIYSLSINRRINAR